jgi:hypothetical protein
MTDFLRGRTRSLFTKVVLTTTLLVTVGATSAMAGVVTSDGATATFTAAPGEANILGLTSESGNVVFQEFGGFGITETAANCMQVSPNRVECSGITNVVAVLGDQDDFVFDPSQGGPMPVPLTIPLDASGGDGDDVLIGGSANDTLRGDAGNDALIGQAGDDTLRGGTGEDFLEGDAGADKLFGDEGDDTLEGDAGADDINGGTGFDAVTYRDRASNVGVTVTLDNQANDGVAGEGDNVHLDVEDIGGGDGNDTLSALNSPGGNLISGGAGNDTIDPGIGEDAVQGNDGDDTLNTRDGFADRVSCGNGNDTANVDQLDLVSADCERINVENRPVARDVPEVPEDAPPSVTIDSPGVNATIATATPTTITATAKDDKGVARVVFIDDDRIVCSDDTAPYTCAYQPRGEDVGRNTLAAVAIDALNQTGFATRTVTVPRFDVGLTIKATPKRDLRSPYTFRTTGKVALPATVTPALGCKGVVAVTFKAGTKTISTRRVKVSSNCTYSAKVTFTIPSRLRPKVLNVRAVYAGNGVVNRKTSKKITVRVRLA